MAEEYGSAYSWIVIIFILFVVGICYIFCLPVLDTILEIGAANPSLDSGTLQMLDDVIHIWFPITVVLSIVVMGWRRSGQNRVG